MHVTSDYMSMTEAQDRAMSWPPHFSFQHPQGTYPVCGPEACHRTSHKKPVKL